MLNKVLLQGRLTANPELRQTPSGANVCSFILACDRNFVAQGQERQADFLTLVAWNKQAEFIAKYFVKGQMMIVEGNLRTRNYNDTRYPEVKHYVTDIYVDAVNFAGDKSQRNNEQSQNNFPIPPDEPRQQSSVPPQRAQQPVSSDFGGLGDFEEVIGESELPF